MRARERARTREGGGEPRMPDSRPEGRRKALAGCDSTHQGPCAFDHYLLG